ncbi:type 2C protein phosphatase PTC1 [Aspergillus ruber CBS 135680]|uniref:PP2C-domain-containing protein n=1 Tax=Aspergillus ruber (strain CBS 135680) TaxID=1388766 RepID=A0A017S8N6_ASPRC|nr:PP2C-domain-containing protein [Aspergillus ruber CBS 135680]EYE92994.1 PP2C-domain-containing protein [Aspergillus ruber CBS 135680]
MFSGSSSPPKDKTDSVPHSNSIDTPSSSLAVPAEDSTVSTKKFSPPTGFFSRRASEDQNNPGGEKKRRSSTVTKAATFFSNAKQSLTLSTQREENSNGSPSSPNPLQKLGNMDAALSVPQGSGNNSAGESIPTARSSFRVGVTEDRNRKCRRTMEDTHAYLYNFLGTPAPSTRAEVDDDKDVSPTAPTFDSTVETDNGYFAIFDGHAGTFAAEWCGKKLHHVLQDVMRRNPNAPVPELLDQTFTSVDQQLEKLPLKNSGCTAVIALLRWEDRVPSPHSATGTAALAPVAAAETIKSEGDTKAGENAQSDSTTVLPKLQEKASRQRVLYTANVGDARAILCRNGKALRLSYDHKGSDENEGKRIASAGGLVLNNRVNGVLAVTRALGDAYLKDLVTGHPYTTETVIQADADEFVILACDGLWDVCSDQEAVELIRNVPDAQEASRVLVDHALARFSTDNLSCMVIRFDSSRVKNVINQAVEPIGVDGDPATAKEGISEADKIVEGTRQSMANAGITDDSENAQKVNEEIIRRMSTDEPGPELSVNEHTDVPQEAADNKPETETKDSKGS